MKKYTLLVMLLSCAMFVFAQDDGDIDEGYGPKKGDWTVEMQFGRGNTLSMPTLPIAAGYASGSAWVVDANSPYANNIDLNSNSSTNMVGVKGGYFITDKIALTLSGALRMDYTPEQANVPGFIQASAPNAAWIPAYAAIPEQNNTMLFTTIGGEYTFSTELERFFPYVGVHIPFFYNRRSAYDPTIGPDFVNSDNGIGTPGSPGNPSGHDSGSIADPNLIVDLGTRHGEVFGFGTQLVAGANYYIMEGFYFGFEIRPVSYVYAYAASKPGPGLETQESNTNTYSFFTQPFMKIGFKF